ncbi:hypothetical protein LguiB_022119 [Lonicera macranthoides]
MVMQRQATGLSNESKKYEIRVSLVLLTVCNSVCRNYGAASEMVPLSIEKKRNLS